MLSNNQRMKESSELCSNFHIVAMPYPSRSHINAMMNLCKILASKKPEILITFVTTEELFSSISSEFDSKSSIFRFTPIPNVIPSDFVQVEDFDAFLDAVLTKMEAPFEEVLDRIEPPVTLILADTLLPWPVGVGNRRNIPVASFFTMSAMMFSVFHHFDLFATKGHYQVDFSDHGDQLVDYIPGVSPTSLKNFPSIIFGGSEHIINGIKEAFSWATKAQYLLLSTFYELESQTIDILRIKVSLPIYTIAPTIPYFNLKKHQPSFHYLKWLDSQPIKSVIYISLGSFLSFSSAQMDEIANGLIESGVKFFWVAREEASKLKGKFGDQGVILEWCDQLRVLCHSSIGAFWSHCGWNSVQEGIYGGVPFLAFPIAVDQVCNCKLIVEDWKIGCRVKENKVGGVEMENLVKKEEIGKVLGKIMDLEDKEGAEMRKRVEEFQEKCKKAIGEGGYSEFDINNFIQEISSSNHIRRI